MIDELLAFTDYIKDEKLKKLAKKIVYEHEQEFRYPSTTTGRWHLEDERGDWGAAIHAMRVTILVLHAYRKNFYLETIVDDLDLLIFAALFHDIPHKCKMVGGELKRNQNHPLDNAAYYKQLLEAAELEDTEWKVTHICALIAYHSGNWLKHSLWPVSYLQDCLHEADHYASRSIIHVDYAVENLKDIYDCIVEES